jgi:hypothetical protein
MRSVLSSGININLCLYLQLKETLLCSRSAGAIIISSVKMHNSWLQLSLFILLFRSSTKSCSMNAVSQHDISHCGWHLPPQGLIHSRGSTVDPSPLFRKVRRSLDWKGSAEGISCFSLFLAPLAFGAKHFADAIHFTTRRRVWAVISSA